jgi:exodeoxyribonuclease-5
VSGVVLTSEQQTVRDAAVDFVESRRPGHLTIGGYAGTGKTTVTAEVVKRVRAFSWRPEVGFCCYTGKAASVLRSKLEAAGAVEPGDYCGTIHGLIYKPVLDEDDRVVGWRKRDELDQDVLFVDEASMVNAAIWNDLRGYGVPIVAVGDHGQLPPIEGAFNLMESPDLRLETIHRQAEGNPIVRLSIAARETGEIPHGYHAAGVGKITATDDQLLAMESWNPRETLFLCGYNRTRVSLNRKVRAAIGLTSPLPVPGDKVICLKNDRAAEVFNGMSGSVEAVGPAHAGWLDASIAMDSGIPYRGRILRAQFGAERTFREWPGVEPKDLKGLFDFGYALTVHKAQGSEADDVVLLEERFPKTDDATWRRWLYTGVTRARRRLLVVDRRGAVGDRRGENVGWR